MKVYVITPLYSIAGVPLAQYRFADALSKTKNEVTLLIGHVTQGYYVPKNVNFKIKIFNKKKVRSLLIPLIIDIYKNKPDVIFSAEDHLNIIVIIASIITFSKVKISCSSRVTPFDTYSGKLFSKGWILKILMKLVMSRADVLSCVSRDMVLQYKSIFNNSRHVNIYNIVYDSNYISKMNETVEHPWLVNKEIPVVIAAGRLATWKGFDTLINATALLLKKRKFKLIILGEGELRNNYQSIIDYNDISDNVDLHGYVNNTFKYFANSDVFVLSSIVEGLPNVLVEAMLCGCTPVSTDCPTGPRELLQDGKYGYLIPTSNIEYMAKAIDYALDHPIEKEKLLEAVAEFKDEVVINKHFTSLKIK